MHLEGQHCSFMHLLKCTCLTLTTVTSINACKSETPIVISCLIFGWISQNWSQLHVHIFFFSMFSPKLPDRATATSLVATPCKLYGKHTAGVMKSSASRQLLQLLHSLPSPTTSLWMVMANIVWSLCTVTLLQLLRHTIDSACNTGRGIYRQTH